MLNIGDNVLWTSNSQFLGTIKDIKRNKATVYFYTPKKLTLIIDMDSLELIDAEYVETDLTEQDYDELQRMYIDLALATGDKEWFNLLTENLVHV